MATQKHCSYFLKKKRVGTITIRSLYHRQGWRDRGESLRLWGPKGWWRAPGAWSPASRGLQLGPWGSTVKNNGEREPAAGAGKPSLLRIPWISRGWTSAGPRDPPGTPGPRTRQAGGSLGVTLPRRLRESQAPCTHQEGRPAGPLKQKGSFLVLGRLATWVEKGPVLRPDSPPGVEKGGFPAERQELHSQPMLLFPTVLFCRTVLFILDVCLHGNGFITTRVTFRDINSIFQGMSFSHLKSCLEYRAL